MAKNITKTIIISAEDSIAEVISVIRRSSEEKLEIYIPEGARIFKNGLNFQLIRSEAQKLGKDIVIDTPDDWGQKTVRVSGITLKQPSQIRHKQPILKKFFRRNSTDHKAVDIASKKSQVPTSLIQTVKKDQDIKIQLPKRPKEAVIIPDRPRVSAYQRVKRALSKIYKRPKFTHRKLIFTFLAAAVLVAFLVIYFLLPSAQIVIEPRRVQVSVQASVVASSTFKEPDVLKSRIPAQILTVERFVEEEYVASGQEELTEPARGTIAIFNAYSSQPQILVKGTRFLSKDGKIFCLDAQVRVPGAEVIEGRINPSSIDAEVYSGEFTGGRCEEAPGEQFNIGPSEFIIPGFQGSPKFNGFYGRSEEAMSGGFEGLATIVSQGDFQKAQDDFDGQVSKSLQKELIGLVPSELMLIDGAIVTRKTEEQVSHGVGEITRRFNISARVKVSALVFNPEHLEMIFLAKLEDQVTTQQFVEDTGDFQFEKVVVDTTGGQLSFKVKGTRTLTSKINQEALIQKLLDKNESQIREILIKDQAIESARLKLIPFWLKKVPAEADKVKVIVK